MSKLICLDCGNVFDECDVAVWYEDRGEYWGRPCNERISGCPRCKGDYASAYRCECCEEWIDGEYVKIGNARYCCNCYTHYELGEEK